jgi:hypothetical protein
MGADTHENETANQTKVETEDNPQASSPAQFRRIAHPDSLVQ